MKHFWGELQGDGKIVARGGTKRTGMTAELHGKNFGVKVIIRSGGGNEDVVDLYLTNGDNKERQLIGTYIPRDYKKGKTP